MDVWLAKGVMGALETHMVVATLARKWADLLRRYACIVLRNARERVVNVLCLVHKNPAKLDSALIRGHKRG